MRSRREVLAAGLARAVRTGDARRAVRMAAALSDYDRREADAAHRRARYVAAAAGDPVGGPMRPVTAARVLGLL